MGMDVYGTNGNYFRANIWQWRAICYAMELSGFEVPNSWGCNDGAGLSSQAECNDLSDKLDKFIASWDSNILVWETDRVRVDKTGSFVPSGTPGSHSPYSVDRDHLEEFVAFLRLSGGFEIR